jgi:hypothetical protein
MDLKTFQEETKKECIVSNGYTYLDHTLQPQQNQCPTCGKVYTMSYSDSKSGSAMDREQHLSGICSEECWNLS